MILFISPLTTLFFSLIYLRIILLLDAFANRSLVAFDSPSTSGARGGAVGSASRSSNF